LPPPAPPGRAGRRDEPMGRDNVRVLHDRRPPWEKIAAAVLLCVAAAPGRCPAQAPDATDRPRVTIFFEPMSEDAESPAGPAPVRPAGCPEARLALAGALAWAGADNPPTPRAQGAVRPSRAEQLRAQALLLPPLDAGASLDVHRGNLQSAEGIIRRVDRQ